MHLSILGLKVVYALMILIESLFFAPIPNLVNISGLLMSAGNTFSAGIFIAIGMLHLLPESNESLTETLSDTFFGKIPLAFILSGIGILFTFFIEKVIFHHSHDINIHEHSKAHSGHSHDSKQHDYKIFKDYFDLENPSDPAVASANDIMHEYASDAQLLATQQKAELKQKIQQISQEQAAKDGITHQENTSMSVMLTFVLSLHGTIAGITMGIHQEQSIITSLFIAIIAHTWIEALALGINMKKNYVPWHKTLMLILIYSFMVPIGIGIGSFADIWLQGHILDVTTGICGAISSGTFVYVAFIDILPEEFHSHDSKYLKFLALIFGFAIAAIFILLFDFD
jgi:zinc transporter 1/2/3